MQELTNDNYSEIKLYSIFHIEYKAIEFSTNKKNQQLQSRSQYWNDNEAAPANGGFVNKANAIWKMTHSQKCVTTCFDSFMQKKRGPDINLISTAQTGSEL